MSYDIYFVRRDPGQSFEDALENTEDSYAGGDPGPLTEVEIEQWERIVPYARAIFGDIDEFESESTRELSHPATGVQLTIFPGEISITVPYSHAEADAIEVMEKVYALARAIEDETGLEGYDPQLDEPIRDASPAAVHGTMGDISRRLDSDEFRQSGRMASASGREPADAGPPAEADAEARPQRRRRWWEFWKS